MSNDSKRQNDQEETVDSSCAIYCQIIFLNFPRNIAPPHIPTFSAHVKIGTDHSQPDGMRLEGTAASGLVAFFRGWRSQISL